MLKFKMGYILYSFPNCTKCNEVKSHLKGKEIKYEEVNAGIGEGREKFRDFYPNHFLLPKTLQEGPENM